MTLDEFFVALAETRDLGWRCSDQGVVRAQTADLQFFCPLTAVAMHKLSEYYPNGDFLSAADALDIDRVLACKIAYSADANSFLDDELALLHQRLKTAVLA